MPRGNAYAEISGYGPVPIEINAEGRTVTTGLAPGTIVHTGGGDYRITGGDGVGAEGSAGYTSEYVGPNTFVPPSLQEGPGGQDGGTYSANGSDDSGSGGYGADTTAEAYIQQIYDQQIAANQAALENAYEMNVNTLNAQRKQLPETYQTAKNTTAAQSELQRANFNEYAAASGLSSGAGGQVQLSMSNELQGNLSSLDKAQANALTQLDLQMTNLTTQYQNNLAMAFAEGNISRVAALYEAYENNRAALMAQQQFEANRQYNNDTLKYNYATLEASQKNMAYNQAFQAGMSSGVFSGMAVFGWDQELIEAAEQWWKEQSEG